MDHDNAMTDVRLYSAPAERNREPILNILRRHLRSEGLVLEIASGSGQHVVHFARALPALRFQPSDCDPAALESIDVHAADAGLGNIRPALRLDVTSDPWPIVAADAVVCINMIHISPWAATEGLMKGAARTLAQGGVLFLYGPYRREGRHTAPSNETFDQSLRARNPEWGVRDLEAVVAEAAKSGLTLAAVEPMPANNFSVILRK
jgi:SAM-dependent methyltransferase